MQTKLKLSAILLTLFFALMPLTTITANAMTFDLRKPSYGLYCENQNTDIHGKVNYVIDENGKAVQYSEYTVKANDDLTLYVPFLSKAYELPEVNITVNGKTVNSEVYYGEKYSHNDNLRFYSCDIADFAGTLYTLTTSSESFTVDFSTLENQSFIYMFTNSFTGKRGNGNYSYTLNNASPEVPYEIFVINGDFAKFESSAEIVKETLTVNEYINRHFDDTQTYYSDFDNITPDVLYAQINRALENNYNYNYFDFFFDGYSNLCVNAYKIYLQTDAESYTITYTMPVDVQKNATFKPEIYLTEQTAIGNYTIDYTIQLNRELPFIIESNAELKKQSDYIYTAQNVSEDFYFVFSSSKQPESIYDDNTNNTLKIVLYVVSGVAICALITLGVYMILHYKKNKKR